MGRAQDKIVFGGKIRELRAAVLDAPVRVVDDIFMVEIQVFDGHIQSPGDQGRPHVVVKRPAHQFFGIGTGHQGEVGVAGICFYVGDIAYKNLFAVRYFQVLYKVW